MRYIVIGAGAVGGAVGGRLHESGHEVVLVARGAHAKALRDSGLALTTPDGTLQLDVPVAERPEEVGLRDGDVLVLAVKTQDSVAALDAWAGRPVAGGGTAAERLPLVCAQNGVENERLALRRFRHVYGACVWLPATYLTPGAIVAPCAPYTGALILGRHPAAGSDADDGTLHEIAAGLRKSRLMAPVVPDVMRWKYGKLVGNLVNAVEAVCGPDAGPGADGLTARARAEAATVLSAAGIAWTSPEEMAELRGDSIDVQPLEDAGPRLSSSAQSLVRGAGSIETDYLNGEIVLLAREFGVPAPVNEALQLAANESARTGRAPGGLTPERILALADGAAATAP